MAVSALANRAETLEAAVKAALIALGDGMDEESVHYVCFQNTLKFARKFPAYAIRCGAPVPNGFNEEFMTAELDIGIITSIDRDELRETLSTLVGKVETMIDAANADVNTWSTTYLPTGWHLNAFMQTDAGTPFVEDKYSLFPLAYEMEVCIP